MNTAQLETITNEAMTLSEKERAKLAHDLVASLDGMAEISVSEAWDAEICRRINEIESGKIKSLDVSEVLERARARLRNRPSTAELTDTASLDGHKTQGCRTQKTRLSLRP